MTDLCIYSPSSLESVFFITSSGSGEGEYLIQGGLRYAGITNTPQLDLNSQVFFLFILCGHFRPACSSFPWDQTQRIAVLYGRGKQSWRDTHWGLQLEVSGRGGGTLVGA